MTRERFSDLVLEYEKSLYRVARAYLRNDEDCADAIQNALLKAYDKLGSLRKEEYFKTWLIRILINECKMIIRSYEDIVPYEEYVCEEKAEEETIGLFELVYELPEKQRVPFVLHYIEGYSIKEIAEMTKTSVPNIKTRLFRAREVLKEKIEGGESDELYRIV